MPRTLPSLGVPLILAILLVAGLTIGATGPGNVQSAAARPRAGGPASASFRFAQGSGDRPEAEPAAPIGLTASDGTGLALIAVEANGVLEPPLAFTELHLTFENPRDQQIEGRFRIALPPGAALSRFAMKNDSGWQEGEVVERRRAQVVYEDFLHRRQDPALLEQEAGNEFSARVFPIPARGRKELIVSYSHAMARADQPYVLPLLGLSEIGQLDVRVLLGGRPTAGSASNLGGEVSDRRVVELHKRAWTPDRDFEIGQDRVADRPGLRHGNLAVVRVSPPVEPVPQEIAGLYVLVDSSASRALGYTTQVRRVAGLIAGLRAGAGAETPLGIAAFDQEVAPIFEGTVGGFGREETQRLAARRPLGASDLGQALGWLANHLSRHRYPRVLLVTDGVATAGDTETRALKAAVHALGARGVERLDVLAVGGLRDEAVLHELTTGNLAHDGQRLDGATPLSEIARRLTLACRSGIKVAVDGAKWVWPETLDGVQAGDQALIYADLPADRPLRLTLAGRPAPLAGEPVPAELPLLERAWAQARIERLVHLRETASAGDDDLRKALGLEIVEVSVKHRVLSPFTAMLVLESTFDYQRFGLDQRSLADILTVGPGGVEVLARRSPALTRQAQAIEPQKRVYTDFDSFGDVAPPAPGDEEIMTLHGEAPMGALAFAAPGPGENESGVEGGVGGVPGGVSGGVVAGVPSGGMVTVQPMVAPSPPRMATRSGRAANSEPTEEKTSQAAPYTGRFAEVKQRLAAGRVGEARALAEAWNTEAPGDVLGLLALGEAWEAAGEPAAAARAYGSLIDLFPSRADLRRLAGERLERLGDAGLTLAIDTYQKAVEQRPDHPSGHRLLAWALLRAGRFEAAFQALEQGIEQPYPGGRFLGVDRVLREDLGLLAAAWVRAEPARREEALDRLQAHGARISTEP
ncbi:MAG TPA: VIT domain-containing protein, partial [Thermoanaerobaculia bacterium]